MTLALRADRLVAAQRKREFPAGMRRVDEGGQVARLRDPTAAKSWRLGCRQSLSAVRFGPRVG